jgi:hypothetical protein
MSAQVPQKKPVEDTELDVLETAHHDPSNASRMGSQLKTDQKSASRYRWKLILGLTLPFTVQALDLTITAPAVPFIASDFST